MSMAHFGQSAFFLLVSRKAVYIEHLCCQHQGSVSQRQPSFVQLGLAAGWTVPRSPAAGWNGSYVKKKFFLVIIHCQRENRLRPSVDKENLHISHLCKKEHNLNICSVTRQILGEWVP